MGKGHLSLSLSRNAGVNEIERAVIALSLVRV